MACQGAWLEWFENDMGKACHRGNSCKRKEARRKKRNAPPNPNCTSIIEKAQVAARVAPWVAPCVNFLSDADARQRPLAPSSVPEDAHHGFRLIDMERAKRLSNGTARRGSVPFARGGMTASLPKALASQWPTSDFTCHTPFGGVPDKLYDLPRSRLRRSVYREYW